MISRKQANVREEYMVFLRSRASVWESRHTRGTTATSPEGDAVPAKDTLSRFHVLRGVCSALQVGPPVVERWL